MQRLSRFSTILAIEGRSVVAAFFVRFTPQAYSRYLHSFLTVRINRRRDLNVRRL